MNFASTLDYKPAFLGELNLFNPMNLVGIYGVINVELANYIGDSEVLNASLKSHAKSDKTDEANELIVQEIVDFFSVEREDDVPDVLLTGLNYHNMLTSVEYLANSLVNESPLIESADLVAEAIAKVDKTDKDTWRKMATFERMSPSSDKFNDELFYQALVMNEQIKVLRAYQLKFGNYIIRVKKRELTQIDREDIGLTVSLIDSFTDVGLEKHSCISKIVEMANVFASNSRELSNNIIVYVLNDVFKHMTFSLIKKEGK